MSGLTAYMKSYKRLSDCPVVVCRPSRYIHLAMSFRSQIGTPSKSGADNGVYHVGPLVPVYNKAMWSVLMKRGPRGLLTLSLRT
jgi:hypothetical protein